MPSLILPNIPIKSLIIGDSHFGILASDGRLFTWGQFSRGQLGHGDPRDVAQHLPQRHTPWDPWSNWDMVANPGEPPYVTAPTVVRFDYGCTTWRRRFCVGAAAGGSQSAALVYTIDVSAHTKRYDYLRYVHRTQTMRMPPNRETIYEGLLYSSRMPTFELFASLKIHSDVSCKFNICRVPSYVAHDDEVSLVQIQNAHVVQKFK